MDRSSFLKKIAFAGAMLLSPKAAEAVPLRTTKLSSPYIAGFKYYGGIGVQGSLRVNGMLDLRREPGNRHDWYAVEVYSGGTKLGYLPRDENKIIARMIDQGIPVRARIIGINLKEMPYRRVRVEVFFESSV